MTRFPATRLLLVALAAAALAVSAIGCGDDDDSDGDSATESPVETTGQAATETTEQAETTSGDAEETGEGGDLFLSYRVVGGADVNPDELGLEIDAGGRGVYEIGQGREIEFQLTEREMDNLRATFERVGFADLPARIGRPQEDAGGVEVEISHDGRSVREVPGTADSPLAPVHAAVTQVIARHAIKRGNLAPAEPGE